MSNIKNISALPPHCFNSLPSSLYRAFFASLTLFTLTACESTLKTVEFINASGERVQISVEGISLYDKSRGPQTLTANVPPKGIQRYSAVSWGPAIINFPLTVSWKPESSDAYLKLDFGEIGGLQPTKNKIYDAGTIVIGIDQTMKPRVFFVPGRGSNSAKHYEMLE
jgi:hypothetical protein